VQSYRLHLVFAFGLFATLLHSVEPISPPSKIHWIGVTQIMPYSWTRMATNVSMVEAAGTAPASETFIPYASTTSALVYIKLYISRCQVLFFREPS